MREVDLLIVGGGASGTAMLQALAGAAVLPGCRRVVLIERGPLPGPGLPYGDTAHPLHTMGRTPTLRHEKGRQLVRRFASAAERLRAQGIGLEVLVDTEARVLRRLHDRWVVETSGGHLTASNVVLGVGHWHVPRLGHLRGLVDWRWDVRRLDAVAGTDDVVILGMGQTGLDAAVALADRRAGRPGAGRIVLASRSGALPGVYGHVSGADAHRATEHLRAVAARDPLTLEALFAAALADAQAVSASAIDSPRAPRRTDPALLRAAMEATPPVELLRRELAEAQRSLAARRALPWQPVLWHGLEPFHEAMPKLCAEDRLALAADWIPIMRHVEAIHAGAAARLLGLIDAGGVEVVTLGASVAIEEEGGAVHVRGSRGEVRAHKLIDARGPDPRVAHSEDAFLRSVLATGAVAAGRVRFQGAPSSAVPETWSVEGEWLVTGGLWVDPATFAVRDEAGGTHGLYALGPLTVGQFPFYAGLWASRRGAQRIVASLGKG